MKVLLFIISVFMLFSCNQPAPFDEGKYIIEKGKTITISQLRLSITNNGCGREHIVSEGQFAGERPFCQLKLTYGDSSLLLGAGFKPVIFGPARIVMDKINPWGREEDSVPAGGCRVIITRLTEVSR